MADKLNSSLFDDFATYYAKAQKLPDGVSFELRNAKTNRKIDRRKVVEYRVVAQKNVPVVSDEETVSALLLGAEALLDMDLNEERMYLTLTGPKGDITRNTKVRSVRALDAPDGKAKAVVAAPAGNGKEKPGRGRAAKKAPVGKEQNFDDTDDGLGFNATVRSDEAHAGFLILLDHAGCGSLPVKKSAALWVALERALGKMWVTAMAAYFADEDEAGAQRKAGKGNGVAKKGAARKNAAKEAAGPVAGKTGAKRGRKPKLANAEGAEPVAKSTGAKRGRKPKVAAVE